MITRAAVNAGFSEQPYRKRDSVRAAVLWPKSDSERVVLPGVGHTKSSVDHSIFSVSTGSMLAARRAGT